MAHIWRFLEIQSAGDSIKEFMRQAPGVSRVLWFVEESEISDYMLFA